MNRQFPKSEVKGVRFDRFGLNIVGLLALLVLGATQPVFAAPIAATSVLTPDSAATLRTPPCPGDPNATEIRSASDFLSMVNYRRSDPSTGYEEVLDGNYKLCNDITMPADFPYSIGGNVTTSSGVSSYPFGATLDGNGFALRNFHAVDDAHPASNGLPGLFAGIYRGTIRNLRIELATNAAGLSAGESLLARGARFARLDDLSVTGTLPAGASNSATLLVNNLFDSSIHNLTLRARMLSTPASGAGLAGAALFCKRSTIDGVQLDLAIQPHDGELPTYAPVAGLIVKVGEVAENSNCALRNVRGSVNLRAKGWLGGLVAYVWRSGLEISDVALTHSRIVGDTASYIESSQVGGLVGTSAAALNVQRAMFQGFLAGYSAGGVVGEMYVGGAPLNINQVAIIDSSIRGGQVGGFVGFARANISITDSLVRDTDILVDPQTPYAYTIGGFIGGNDDPTTFVRESYFSGRVDDQNIYLRDPIIGLSACYGHPELCVRASHVYFNADLYAGAVNQNETPLSTEQMTTLPSSYLGFDFVATWNPPAGGCYAELRNAPRYRSADLNADGLVSIQDLFDFLSLYFSGDLRADLSANQALSNEDLFGFLNVFFSGSACE